MTTILMTAAISLTAATAMTFALRAVDRYIRRRQQLAFLRGPLRDQLQYMMNRPMELPAAPATATVTPIQPVAMLTDQKLCA